LCKYKGKNSQRNLLNAKQQLVRLFRIPIFNPTFLSPCFCQNLPDQTDYLLTNKRHHTPHSLIKRASARFLERERRARLEIYSVKPPRQILQKNPSFNALVTSATLSSFTKSGAIKKEQDASARNWASASPRCFGNETSKQGFEQEQERNMSKIGFRNRFYQQRQTWPQPHPPKASAQAANEPRAANEQSPPPVTPETPEKATSLNPSSKASSIEVFRQHLKDGLTSAEDIARKMGVSKGTVSKLSKRAMNEGWCRKNGRQYALVR
jgi:hypothetical protein